MRSLYQCGRLFREALLKKDVLPKRGGLQCRAMAAKAVLERNLDADQISAQKVSLVS